jgi:hypothetical protein
MFAPGRLFGRSHKLVNRLALIVAGSLVLGGCTSTPHKWWPFHKKAKPAPEVVHEVDLVNADGTPANYPQIWKRNTLVIDLSGVSGSGAVTARLPADTTWPVRVAVRVQPGSVQQVEVQGEERNVMAVSTEAGLPIDLEFASSVYRKTTAAIYINWGFMPQFAEAVVEPENTFQSPMEVPNKPQGAAPAAAPTAAPAAGPAPAVPAIPAPGSDADHPPDVPPPPAPPPGTRKPATIMAPPTGASKGAPLPENASENDGSASEVIPQPSPPPGN